jgi:2-haloacid dehalogenase
MLQSAAHHAGLDGLLDVLLSVEAVGVFKPHPKVYRLATERLGIEAVVRRACVLDLSRPAQAAGG